MTENNTSAMLDQLAEFYAMRDVLAQAEQSAIEAVLTPEIMQQVADIREEFSGKRDAATININRLEENIKASVLTEGKTIRGSELMAVWNKGRSGGWDSKKLDGFALAHPEILVAKKPDGEPSVSIRAAGK